jgi:hypothetical protein
MAKTSTLMDATKRMQRIAGEKGKKETPVEDNIKVTLYIRHDQMFALEDIRTKRLKAGAKLGDVDKSKLMREAIDLLIKKESK